MQRVINGFRLVLLIVCDRAADRKVAGDEKRGVGILMMSFIGRGYIIAVFCFTLLSAYFTLHITFCEDHHILTLIFCNYFALGPFIA